MTGVDFGFACLTVGVRGTKQRTCTMKNATEDLLCDLIHRNFTALDNILEYCSRIGIRLFRVSSDIIPFGSHPVNTLAWWDTFGSKLKELGDMLAPVVN